MTQQELLRSLDFLGSRGFWGSVKEVKGDIWWAKDPKGRLGHSSFNPRRRGWSRNGEVDYRMANIGVMVKEDESFEKALRRFRKQVDKAGVMKEMKRHM
jgi:hypothetical protein